MGGKFSHQLGITVTFRPNTSIPFSVVSPGYFDLLCQKNVCRFSHMGRPHPPRHVFTQEICSFPNGRNVHDQKSRFPYYTCPLLKTITPLGVKKWLFQVVYNLNLSIVLVYIECLGLRCMSTEHSSIATPKNIVPSLKLTVRP